jgi:hypothetical protein
VVVVAAVMAAAAALVFLVVSMWVGGKEKAGWEEAGRWKDGSKCISSLGCQR